jgi:DNA-binding NtrC family response regulator
LTEEARSCLVRYDWPGNVRELENAIERAVVLGSADRIRVDDLPENILEPGTDQHGAARNYHQAVQSAKRHIVTAALAEAAGSHAAAARLLGLHPNNLHRLIRNLNLKDFIEN